MRFIGCSLCPLATPTPEVPRTERCWLHQITAAEPIEGWQRVGDVLTHTNRDMDYPNGDLGHGLNQIGVTTSITKKLEVAQGSHMKANEGIGPTPH